MLVTGDLDEQSNTALHYSVTCAEDVPRVTASEAASVLASLRTRTLAERALSVCTAWPKGVAPADATTPVKSDVPVLILSGGLDPVTPPANGAEVARSLPKSRHIVAQGYGHIVSLHACAPRLIAAFIDDPTFESLPASCVEHFEKSRRPPLWPTGSGRVLDRRRPPGQGVRPAARSSRRRWRCVHGTRPCDHGPPGTERRRQDDAPADALDADDSRQRHRAHRGP
jgi:hypothetical protein